MGWARELGIKNTLDHTKGHVGSISHDSHHWSSRLPGLGQYSSAAIRKDDRVRDLPLLNRSLG